MRQAAIVSSWGNVARGKHLLFPVRSRSEGFPDVTPAMTALPYGNGRSYGDSCLNVGGALLQTRQLDRFIQFDPGTGVLACEAGVLLDDILQRVVRDGWFLPVVPGTRYVTVGGAIANDVHGKNHHCAGTFGGHVEKLELARSSGERLTCSRTQNPAWFAATIGGLGLTGLITSAQIQLRPVPGPWLDVETIRYAGCDEFFKLSEQSETAYEYTVAWVDCLARGRHLGRGLFQRATHANRAGSFAAARRSRWSVPFTPPISCVNPLSLRLLNGLHYRGSRARTHTWKHFQSFFFPLDGLRQWNRLYGPKGFFQYQCVIPTRTAEATTLQMLSRISASGLGSCLAVLKRCGPAVSPGMLSFPRTGVMLALDFPNRSARLEKLFCELDELVGEGGGRLYPAKDARMPAELFRSGYPRWREFSQFVDPRCSSDFWRRVTGQP